jgi:hypothetical protein
MVCLVAMVFSSLVSGSFYKFGAEEKSALEMLIAWAVTAPQVQS